MGRGNSRVNGKYEGLYYVDYENFNEVILDDNDNPTNDIEFNQTLFEDDVDNIKLAIQNRTSFVKCDRYNGRDSHVVMENKLFEIVFEDNEWSLAIKLIQKEDSYNFNISNLQKKHYQNYLSIIRTVLFELYPSIGIYGGTWTSGTIHREDYELINGIYMPKKGGE